MAAPPVKTSADVKVRCSDLRRRFEDQYDVWREADAWHRMDQDWLEDRVWYNIPPNARRRTILKSDGAAVINTGISFLAADKPLINSVPIDPTSVRDADYGNQLDLYGRAVTMKWDEQRPVSIFHEGSYYAFLTGHLVSRCLWLSPEERGEERVTVPGPENILGFPGTELSPDGEEITEEGSFPIAFDHLHPLECAWVLADDGTVIEFLHHYKTTWAAAIQRYPELERGEAFANYRKLGNWDQTVTIQDYWNEDINCVLLDEKTVKAPTKHHYSQVPFFVDMCAAVVEEEQQDVPMQWGTPFLEPCFIHLQLASWADSIIQPYLETVAYATLVHRGQRNSPGLNPYVQINPETGYPEYVGLIDHGPGAQIVAAYDDQDFKYLEPPRIVEILQEFKAQRMRDIQVLTFAEPILTGVYQVSSLSGISVSQQKQAAMQRMEPYAKAMNRHYTRVLTWTTRLFAREWDRGGQPLLVNLLRGQQPVELELSPELVGNIAAVTVTMQPRIPINQEAEHQMWFQGMAQDVWTLREVQEKVGVENPSWSFKQRIFEKVALNNPAMMEAVAWQHAVDEGYLDPSNPKIPPGATAAPAPPQASTGPTGLLPGGPADPMGAAGDPMAGMLAGLGMGQGPMPGPGGSPLPMAGPMSADPMAAMGGGGPLALAPPGAGPAGAGPPMNPQMLAQLAAQDPELAALIGAA